MLSRCNDHYTTETDDTRIIAQHKITHNSSNLQLHKNVVEVTVVVDVNIVVTAVGVDVFLLLVSIFLLLLLMSTCISL